MKNRKRIENQISIIPIKNVMLSGGDILRILEDEGVESSVLSHLYNRFLGGLKNISPYKHLNIYNVFAQALRDEGWLMINEATGQPRFDVRELERYEKYIDKLEEVRE